MADFLAAVLDRGETIPVMQTAVASLALSGFEAHRDAPLPAKPSDSPDELITGHGIAYTYVRIRRRPTPFVKTLSADFRDTARDAIGGGLDGIVGEVGVAGGGLHLGVAEQLPDHRQALADQQPAAGEAVA